MMHPISGGDKHDQQGRLGRPFKYLNRLITGSPNGAQGATKINTPKTLMQQA